MYRESHNNMADLDDFFAKKDRKKAKGKKLDTWEKEFVRENRDLVELGKRYSQEELEEQERLNKILNGEL